MKNKLLILLITLTPISAFSTTPTAVGIVANTTQTGNGSGLTPAECLSGTGSCNIYSVYAGNINAALSAGGYYPFYKDGSLWQVGNGVTAYCFNKTIGAETQSVRFQLISASNSFSFGGTPSGVIYYQAGAASKYHDIVPASLGLYTLAPAPGTFRFSQNYWPGMQTASATAGIYHMDCYEK